MTIKLVEDIGAPLVVTVLDLGTETAAPEWNEWAAYIAAIGGYVGAGIGWGGPFLKNVGIASFPWAAKKIYERARGVTSRASKQVAYKAQSRVSRYPARASEAPFQGVKLV